MPCESHTAAYLAALALLQPCVHSKSVEIGFEGIGGQYLAATGDHDGVEDKHRQFVNTFADIGRKSRTSWEYLGSFSLQLSTSFNTFSP